MLFRGKMEIANLEIKAIHTASDVPADSPLLTLSPSDVLPQFTRNKTYDLVSKVNAMVTMIKSGVHGRVAMETVDLFTDVAQAWADSKEVIDRYQEAIINRDIAAKLAKCSPATLNAVSRMIDTLLEQQRAFSE